MIGYIRQHPTKILHKDIARDGGTVRLETDTGGFYIDRRIGTKTRDAVYYLNEENERCNASPELTKIVHDLHNQYARPNSIHLNAN